MSRILLADDSPHAQRMGERILREEGFEVVTVTDGETAILRLSDVDPDLVLADAFLPKKNGYEICRYIKSHPRHRGARVVLTAGLLEPIDEAEAMQAGADAILKKPFEASVVVKTIKPLLEAAESERGPKPPVKQPQAEPAQEKRKPAVAVAPVPAPSPLPRPVAVAETAPPPPEIDAERVRAAVTLALEAALPTMIDEISERVLIALGH